VLICVSSNPGQTARRAAVFGVAHVTLRFLIDAIIL
jgi:hypothetical protein